MCGVAQSSLNAPAKPQLQLPVMHCGHWPELHLHTSAACTSCVMLTVIGRDSNNINAGIMHSAALIHACVLAMLCTSSSSLQRHRSKGFEHHSRNCTEMK